MIQCLTVDSAPVMINTEREMVWLRPPSPTRLVLLISWTEVSSAQLTCLHDDMVERD